ncbi:MAG TPA: chloramphenicol acetyltransferase [Spirochaetia bacterium]|nr:MAG: chloramphenicol acetyltransferase [Spirochaetes bacterium GWB1_36_13]HCL56560.1 chloramphenicol acetyltransferase [Spirochaetia bacterium]
MYGPNPKKLYPVSSIKRIVFLKNIIKNPKIIAGDYSYYDNDDDPKSFEKNVLYLYPFSKDRLLIGKFCAIASGVKFMMNGANHVINGLSTYPFPIFQNGWEKYINAKWPYKGDTVIGNDVWIGYQSVIMPGIKIGDGAIISAMSVVTKDVPPYTIVGGNPANKIRTRFNQEVIDILMNIQWWNWSIEKITEAIPILMSENIDELKNLK